MNCENCANAYDEGYTAGHNAENARLREQAEALAAAAEGIVRAVDAHHPKFAHGPFTLTGEEIDACRAALRAYQEAVRHESENTG